MVEETVSFWRTLSRREVGSAAMNHSMSSQSWKTPLWSCQCLNSSINSSINSSAVLPVIDAVCIFVITSPFLSVGENESLNVFLKAFQVPRSKTQVVAAFAIFLF